MELLLEKKKEREKSIRNVLVHHDNAVESQSQSSRLLFYSGLLSATQDRIIRHNWLEGARDKK